jgi:hypothetical protein
MIIVMGPDEADDRPMIFAQFVHTLLIPGQGKSHLVIPGIILHQETLFVDSNSFPFTDKVVMTTSSYISLSP